jgi:hypothetical protein
MFRQAPRGRRGNTRIVLDQSSIYKSLLQVGATTPAVQTHAGVEG